MAYDIQWYAGMVVTIMIYDGWMTLCLFVHLFSSAVPPNAPAPHFILTTYNIKIFN